MVQNIEDPEIYAHLLLNQENFSLSHNLKYRDNCSDKISNDIDLERDSILSERLPVYCIPITGLNINESITEKFSKMELETSENRKISYKDLKIDPFASIQTFFKLFKEKGMYNSNNPHSFPIIIKVKIFLIFLISF